jgi:hypothetical protein
MKEAGDKTTEVVRIGASTIEGMNHAHIDASISK